MIARVTIIDDNGNPKGDYELKPSRVYEGVKITKYTFKFDYFQMKDSEQRWLSYKKESEE